MKGIFVKICLLFDYAINLCKKANDIFNDFHGDKLKLCRDPIIALTHELKKKIKIESEILNLSIKTRFFIRIKHLNKCLRTKEISFQKRHVNHVNKFK